MKNAGILVSGFAAIILLCFLCVRSQAPDIEDDLFRRTSEALRSNRISPEGISFTGRDATLTGAAGSPIVSERARGLVNAVAGVRFVTSSYLAAEIPPKPAQTEAAPSRRDIAALLNRDSIGFEYDSADLTQNGKKSLDSIGSVLAVNRDLKIEIQGHTDSLGDAAWNLDLSLRRATSIKAYLVSRGISADRLNTAGFGAARPVAGNDTLEGRHRNRRIEFKAIGGG